MIDPRFSSLAIFIACYALFVVFQKHRSWVAAGGAIAVVVTGALPWHDAVFEAVSWNVIGLFVGTLVLADLFLHSRMPAVMAERLVSRTRTASGAMVAVCVLSGALSVFVENVAVVLLVAPVALSLADKLKVSPLRLIIFIALSSNLQGTATLIGDPPSMLLAGFMKMDFNDFFFYRGRPGIFFAVQVGALASIAVIAWFLRAHHQATGTMSVETVRSWTPSVLLIALVIGLATSTVWDPDFEWFAGVYTLVLAVIGLVWYRWVAKWGRTRDLMKGLDWDTSVFLVGVFVIVGALSSSGWLERLSAATSDAVGGSVFLAFVAIVAISVVISGFVDNVPFLAVMIPVVQQVAARMNAEVPLLMFGLLIGACLGGNITPVGASANVVAMGILRKRGTTVSFGEFMTLGIPFTVAAVVAACVLVWVVWS